MLRDTGRAGGEAFHVRDSLVWAEIYYLDSTSDYREYLPRPISVPNVDSDLVMLDSRLNRSSSGKMPSAASALLAAIIALAFFLLFHLCL